MKLNGAVNSRGSMETPSLEMSRAGVCSTGSTLLRIRPERLFREAGSVEGVGAVEGMGAVKGVEGVGVRKGGEVVERPEVVEGAAAALPVGLGFGFGFFF